MRAALLLLIVALVAGCARPIIYYAYDEYAPALPYRGAAQIAVATQDLRDQVRDGTWAENRVGTFHDAGTTRPIETKSQQAVAEVFSESIAKSLTGAGFATRTVRVETSASPATVNSKLAATGADRAVLVRINGWSVINSGIGGAQQDWNLVVTVLDRQGKPLATKTLSGAEHKLSTQFGLMQRYRDLLGEALNDSDVASALQGK